jgi:hypothetical protein
MNKNRTINIFGKTFYIYRISHRFIRSEYFVSRKIFPLNGQTSIILKINLVFPSENSIGTDYLFITTDNNFNGKLLFIRQENRPYYNTHIKIRDFGFYQISVGLEDIELVSINSNPLTITDKEFSKIKKEIIKLYK